MVSHVGRSAKTTPSETRTLTRRRHKPQSPAAHFDRTRSASAARPAGRPVVRSARSQDGPPKPSRPEGRSPGPEADPDPGPDPSFFARPPAARPPASRPDPAAAAAAAALDPAVRFAHRPSARPVPTDRPVRPVLPAAAAAAALVLRILILVRSHPDITIRYP